MKKNKKWFSIIIAMWLVLVSSYFAYTILSYIYPFSQNIKWIENSAKAYYQANNWIEKWLYYLATRDDDELTTADTSKISYDSNTLVDYKYMTTVSTYASSWNIYMPYSGQWNSEDLDYNLIKIGTPINLSIWYGALSLSSAPKITFKVPKIWTSSYKINWDATNPYIINWKLSSEDDSLNSNSTAIEYDDINLATPISLFGLSWENLALEEIDFHTFYVANCSPLEKCTLKFTIINILDWIDSASSSRSITIPYIEWRLDTWDASNNIPLRYSIIESAWKSYWFSRDLEVRYWQGFTSEAFDFTVLQ